jgi:hypothetical protein
MAKQRTLILSIAVVALLICSFMAGRVMAQQSAIPGAGLGQQQLPAETVVPYGFPRSWGGLHSVTPSSSGFAYFFVAADGTVRVVDANAGSIVQIRVIPPR